MTLEQLHRSHPSIPHNPLLCEPMFLACYAEKAGSGILDMIARCRKAGLPEPDFRQAGVVSDVERSKLFYRDVLGATVYREYGGTSCVLQFQGTWLLLVTGGGPTEDKPTVVFAPPADPDVVSHEITLRVPDCRGAYETLQARGAEFLTPPVTYEWEIRAFFRDPDGHLLEISETR